MGGESVFRKMNKGHSKKSRFKKFDFETKIIVSVFIGSILFIGVGAAVALEPNDSDENSIHNEEVKKEVIGERASTDDEEQEKRRDKMKQQEETESDEKVEITSELEETEVTPTPVKRNSGTKSPIITDSGTTGNSAQRNSVAPTTPAKGSKPATTEKTITKPKIGNEEKDKAVDPKPLYPEKQEEQPKDIDKTEKEPEQIVDSDEGQKDQGTVELQPKPESESNGEINQGSEEVTEEEHPAQNEEPKQTD